MGKVTFPCFISRPEANVLSFIKIDFTLGTRPKHQEYHKKLKGKKLMRPIRQSSWNSYIGGYQYLYSLSLEIMIFFFGTWELLSFVHDHYGVKLQQVPLQVRSCFIETYV